MAETAAEVAGSDAWANVRGTPGRKMMHTDSRQNERHSQEEFFVLG